MPASNTLIRPRCKLHPISLIISNSGESKLMPASNTLAYCDKVYTDIDKISIKIAKRQLKLNSFVTLAAGKNYSCKSRSINHYISI